MRAPVYPEQAGTATSQHLRTFTPRHLRTGSPSPTGCGGATYLLSELLLANMPYAMASRRSVTAPPAGLGASVRAGIAEYAESLRYLGEHGRVLLVALQKGFLSIFFSAFQITSVAIAPSNRPSSWPGIHGSIRLK